MNDTPTLHAPRSAAADTTILPSYFPAPGLGLVPVNAYLIHAREPVLVDTGLSMLRDAFVMRLGEIVPLESLRWLWLTHTDADHTGSIHAILERAPKLRVVTTYIGMAKMSLTTPLPGDRVYLLNPGERLDVGDRTLECLRPPTFDAPETTALYDSKTRTLISSDCFGAVVQRAVDSADAFDELELRRAMELWASLDTPWLESLDPVKYDRRFARIRELAPSTVLSSHLPPAKGITDRLVTNLLGALSVAPFVGPNQQAFEAMVRQAAE